MCRVLILADDLTGALDTAEQFQKAGLDTLVTMDITTACENTGAQVVSVDMESRHDTPRRAAQKVALAAAFAVKHNYSLIYKKVDSTLRGNVGSEIAALLELFKGKCLTFAPAFPETGRTTVDGIQLIDGQPIEKAAPGEDLLNPVRESTLEGVIRRTAVVKTLRIPEGGELPEDLSGTILCCDARSPKDLDELASRLFKQEGLKIAAGSAGFAAAICRTAFANKKPPANQTAPTGKLLIVCGSLNRSALRQLEFAESCGVKCFTMDQRLFCGKKTASIIYDGLEGQVSEALNVSSAAAICTAAGDSSFQDERIKEIAARVPELMGELTADIVRDSSVDTILVLGGDTLKGVLVELGCSVLFPTRELEPGIVEAIPGGGVFGGRIIAMSGSFGNESFIMELLDRRA